METLCVDLFLLTLEWHWEPNSQLTLWCEELIRWMWISTFPPQSGSPLHHCPKATTGVSFLLGRLQFILKTSVIWMNLFVTGYFGLVVIEYSGEPWTEHLKCMIMSYYTVHEYCSLSMAGPYIENTQICMTI